jgi:hypothetical protein
MASALDTTAWSTDRLAAAELLDRVRSTGTAGGHSLRRRPQRPAVRTAIDGRGFTMDTLAVTDLQNGDEDRLRRDAISRQLEKRRARALRGSSPRAPLGSPANAGSLGDCVESPALRGPTTHRALHQGAFVLGTSKAEAGSPRSVAIRCVPHVESKKRASSASSHRRHDSVPQHHRGIGPREGCESVTRRSLGPGD